MRDVYAFDIEISAPSRVFIRGRGLDAELGGRLGLGGVTGDVVPEGEFALIRGRLDILGKRLLLSEGSMQVRGDFDPYIRIVAETTAEDVSILCGTRGDTWRFYEAGGGTKADFDRGWAAVARWMTLVREGVAAGTYHSARGFVMYLTGGRAPTG